VRLEHSFAQRLERMLNGRGDRVYEVVNAGHNGFNTRDELAFLLNYGLALDPDMVICGYMGNDFTMDSLRLEIEGAEQDDTDRLFVRRDPCHPSPQGHRVITETVAPLLTEMVRVNSD
jgi:lysophospholipase L1-like esterase